VTGGPQRLARSNSWHRSSPRIGLSVHDVKHLPSSSDHLGLVRFDHFNDDRYVSMTENLRSMAAGASSTARELGRLLEVGDHARNNDLRPAGKQNPVVEADITLVLKHYRYGAHQAGCWPRRRRCSWSLGGPERATKPIP
jgi:hypothetical protein